MLKQEGGHLYTFTPPLPFEQQKPNLYESSVPKVSVGGQVSIDTLDQPSTNIPLTPRLMLYQVSLLCSSY